MRVPRGPALAGAMLVVVLVAPLALLSACESGTPDPSAAPGSVASSVSTTTSPSPTADPAPPPTGATSPVPRRFQHTGSLR